MQDSNSVKRFEIEFYFITIDNYNRFNESLVQMNAMICFVIIHCKLYTEKKRFGISNYKRT